MSEERRRKRESRTAVAKGRSVRQPASVSVPSPASDSALLTIGSAFSGRALWTSLALIAINMVVFAPVWHHEFLDYDDGAFVADNPIVSAGLTWRGVWWAF